MTISITLIGGPTALIEIDGLRLLTDPTFDAPGTYQLPHVKLEKLEGPAMATDALGEIDADFCGVVSRKGAEHQDVLGHDRGGDVFTRYVFLRVRFTNALAGYLIMTK